jgi:hypothetical protein
VPSASSKAWHVMVLTSTLLGVDRILRPQIAPRFRRTGVAVLRSMPNCWVAMVVSRQDVVVRVTDEAEAALKWAALVRVKDFVLNFNLEAGNREVKKQRDIIVRYKKTG